MLEEYPHSTSMITQEDEGHWIFEAELVSYVGISRFILGLFDHVEVLENDDLKAFLNEKMSRWKPFE